MNPDPVKIDEHTTMSGVRAGSVSDDHDVRRAEITKYKFLGMKQRDGILDVLVDVVWKELPSVACLPSRLSMDIVHHNHKHPAAHWHTRVQHRRKPLVCEQAMSFRMILWSKLHNHGCVGECQCIHKRGHHHILIGRSSHGGKV